MMLSPPLRLMTVMLPRHERLRLRVVDCPLFPNGDLAHGRGRVGDDLTGTRNCRRCVGWTSALFSQSDIV